MNQTSNKPSGGYYPVLLDSVKPEWFPPVNVYVNRNPGYPPVLYQGKSLALTEEDFLELIEAGFEEIWIGGKDADAFNQSLQQHVVRVIEDPAVPVPDKCRVSYNASMQHVHQLFLADDPCVARDASIRIMEPLSRLIFKNQHGAHYLIRQASVYYQLYTHSVHVYMLGVALAKRVLGISEREAIETYGLGFLLHDIGKIQLSEDLLDREHMLTGEEWKEYRKHPVIGVEIARKWMDTTSQTETIIRYHHERIDGSGFPDGLKGDDIPVEAKLCAIVDTFDRLTTKNEFYDRNTTFEALKKMKTDTPDKFDWDFLKEFIMIFLDPETLGE